MELPPVLKKNLPRSSCARRQLFSGLLAFVGLQVLSAAPSLRIVADFEGASIREARIDQQKRWVEFMPGGDPVRGWPCWWYFRVEGAEAGETITLRLRGSNATVSAPGHPLQKPLAPAWAMPAQAACSFDGTEWHQTPKGTRDGEWMTYSIRAEAPVFWVGWGPPYTPRDAVEFVRKSAEGRSGVEARELCLSREGRSVPLLHVSEGQRPARKRYGVWVQARQHAWESGSSWVAQGFAECLLSDLPAARWIRERAELYVVPVMDVDNAATGNGGKDALPHDHNRDWSETPHWRETLAAQKIVRSLSEEGRMDVFLDLHNPGPGDPTFFYVLDRQMIPPAAQELRDRFLDLGYAHISKGEPFIPMSNRPKFTGPAYHPLWRNISANWVAMNANPHSVAVCLETIWNYSSGTPSGYRAVGNRLAEALHAYLAERPPRD